MNKEAQKRTPFADALEEYCQQQMVPFHTPGHKLGTGAPCSAAAGFGPYVRSG